MEIDRQFNFSESIEFFYTAEQETIKEIFKVVLEKWRMMDQPIWIYNVEMDCYEFISVKVSFYYNAFILGDIF